MKLLKLLLRVKQSYFLSDQLLNRCSGNDCKCSNPNKVWFCFVYYFSTVFCVFFHPLPSSKAKNIVKGDLKKLPTFPSRLNKVFSRCSFVYQLKNLIITTFHAYVQSVEPSFL